MAVREVAAVEMVAAAKAAAVAAKEAGVVVRAVAEE